MCGIVGFAGNDKALPVLLDGLARLEYRGYDSAGVAVQQNGRLKTEKIAGKLGVLRKAIRADGFRGTLGIGHSRWATHGPPTKQNAHPHTSCDRRIAVVHNGIIENHEALRAQLIAAGHTFRSDTDTEVIVHLIEEQFRGDLAVAVRAAARKLKGSYALAVIGADDPGKIVAMRIDNPLVIGVGKDANYLASDVPAILPYTRDILFLENGELAIVTEDGVTIRGRNGRPVKRKIVKIAWNIESAEKAGYPHFMLKEIHEQPEAIRNTLSGRTNKTKDSFVFPDIGLSTKDLKRIDRIVFVACGTAWHAALVGTYAMQEVAQFPASAAMASEFRYGDPVLSARSLVVAISQSGETLDTLMAVKEARARGAKTLAICNVVGSSIVRECDGVIHTHAGPEIGVASTKAYTTQLTVIAMLSVFLGRLRGSVNPAGGKRLVSQIRRLPAMARKTLECESAVKKCARNYAKMKNFLYVGRRYNFPTAYEGALKLKEISYIHAEGYGAGEMKHGPIALVDGTFPAVAVAVAGRVYDKMISNIQEIAARGGTILAVATEGDKRIGKHADTVFPVPKTLEMLSPILAVIPLQLLAYYIAVKRGCDVDQPRNLAKSVTVE